MLKPIFAVALAALTYASFAAPAEARHNFCHRFPDAERCLDYDDGDLPIDRFRDEDEEDLFIERRPRRFDRSCRGIARWLAVNYDYRRIRITDCGGRNFGYQAVRGPWLYIVKVDSRRVRIISEVRLRRF